MNGYLSRTVISPDGKKFYLQNPISQNFDSENNWIVGDIDENNVVTFQLPQLINHSVYYDEDDPEVITNEYYDYAVKLEFIVENEETQEGWYHLTQDQTYRLQLNEDGSITSLEGDYMLGMADWFEADPEEETEAHWSWQGNGDVIQSMSNVTPENTGALVEVPENVVMNEWQLKTTLSSRPVNVGIDGDNVYITGLFNREGMYDAAVVGKLKDGKVTFENGQYLGEYWYNATLSFFLTGHIEPRVDEETGETYDYFVISDNLVFDYDADKKVLDAKEGAFCVSTMKDQVSYYVMVNKPNICVPDYNINVTKLMTPVLDAFYDVDEEDDYDAEFYFDIPTLDTDGNFLVKENIYYQVMVDGEPFVFYNDEYELPGNVESTDMIPFGYYSEESYDFSADGINHGLILHTRGFTTLGVRTLYNNPDKSIVYSDVMYLPGYDPNGVKAATSAEIASVKYFNLMGFEVANTENGIFVRQTVYTDGSVKCTKVARR